MYARGGWVRARVCVCVRCVSLCVVCVVVCACVCVCVCAHVCVLGSVSVLECNKKKAEAMQKYDVRKKKGKSFFKKI